jgi:tetratricopeptide (TPR) repeat protein
MKLSILKKFDGLIDHIIENLRNQPKLSDYYLHGFLICMGYCFHWIGTSVSTDTESLNTKGQLFSYLNKQKEIIDIIDNSSCYATYFEARFYAYTIFASFNLILGAYHAETQFEIKSLYKNAKNWHKKAEGLLPNVKFNTSISTYHIVRFSLAIAMIILGYSSTDCVAFGTGALDQTKIEITRLEFANRILNIMDFGKSEVPMVSDPNYKLYNFLKNVELCTVYAVLGDLSKDQNEKSKYIKEASELLENLSDFSKQRIIGNQAYFLYFFFTAIIGVILANNSKEIAEKKRYYEMTIELLESAINTPFNFHRYDNLFLLGKTYHDLGKLLNDEELLKKSFTAYMNAIEFCKLRGFYGLVGFGYVHLAQLEDRLGNFLSASDNYQKAISSFNQALLIFTETTSGKTFEKTNEYLTAWKLIEIAKSYHANEDHTNARINFEQASSILQKIREYRFEAPFYIAWGQLEQAEEISKQNKHEEAAEAYNKSKDLFKDAIETFNSYLKKEISLEDKQRISNLINVAEIQERYCTARHQIETARLESLKGNHLGSAELYNKASSLFENLCQIYRIKREKDELMSVCYLCKAWENLERGEINQNALLYATASDLFLKASQITNEDRTKKLSLGNSLYCCALESGILFDNSVDLEEKMKNYKKIKMYLRDSSKNYQMGGFEQDAKWVLATSTFFDGIWHLIRSDNEMDFSKKNQYLTLAVEYLKSALNLFEEVGSLQKKENILKYLEMITTEKAILTSALDVIEKPAISESSIGILAPICPVEISSSLSLEEMQKNDLQAESELNWYKRIRHLYLFVRGGICIYDYPFQRETEADEAISPGMVSAGLESISMLIQELTSRGSNVKIVEQEDMTIMLEHGKYCSGALITEDNLMILQRKLKQLIQEIEEFYQEELENFKGNISSFSKVGKFIQKYFAKPLEIVSNQ